jgi:hypothetical protein
MLLSTIATSSAGAMSPSIDDAVLVDEHVIAERERRRRGALECFHHSLHVVRPVEIVVVERAKVGTGRLLVTGEQILAGTERRHVARVDHARIGELPDDLSARIVGTVVLHEDLELGIRLFAQRLQRAPQHRRAIVGRHYDRHERLPHATRLAQRGRCSPNGRSNA